MANHNHGVLLDGILTGACSDGEQLWALRQAFEDNVPVAADTFLLPLVRTGERWEDHHGER